MRKTNRILFWIPAFLVTLCLLCSPKALARIGVGVGTGKIVVEEKLNPGTIYEFPSLSVLNTGDEPSEYTAGVEYHQDQEQLLPKREWFNFSPDTFHLEPGEVQVVKITLSVPIKAVPGDYFAYLEGSPVKKSVAGETSIGIAAAAKLYFSIAPANVFQGIYYRIVTFWKANRVVMNGLSLGLLAVLLFRLFKKYFKVSVTVNKQCDGDDS